jgi:hypothetical protein
VCTNRGSDGLVRPIIAGGDYVCKRDRGLATGFERTSDKKFHACENPHAHTIFSTYFNRRSRVSPGSPIRLPSAKSQPRGEILACILVKPRRHRRQLKRIFHITQVAYFRFLDVREKGLTRQDRLIEHGKPREFCKNLRTHENAPQGPLIASVSNF